MLILTEPYSSSPLRGERDWIAEEFFAEADKLADLNRRVVKFLIDVGAEQRVLTPNQNA
jgi:hypothetical protein